MILPCKLLRAIWTYLWWKLQFLLLGVELLVSQPYTGEIYLRDERQGRVPRNPDKSAEMVNLASVTATAPHDSFALGHRVGMNRAAFLPSHRLNMELDLHSLFGLHVHSCTHWQRPRRYTTSLCNPLSLVLYQNPSTPYTRPKFSTWPFSPSSLSLSLLWNLPVAKMTREGGGVPF